MAKSMKPGGGGRFQKFTQSLESKGMSKEQASAVAAAAGRKKYGNAGMSKMAAQGRKRASKGK